jgi:hypothetical protein
MNVVWSSYLQAILWFIQFRKSNGGGAPRCKHRGMQGAAAGLAEIDKL